MVKKENDILGWNCFKKILWLLLLLFLLLF